MSWQIYTAISVIGLSVSIILQRILLHKHKTDPVAYSVLFQVYVAVILLMASLIFGFTLKGLVQYWQIALLCIACYGIGTVIYAKTLQKVEASTFSMLFATHAIWVMALGIIIFSESISILQIIGSLLIFGSVIMLSKNLKEINQNKGLFYGLLTGFLYGIAITSWAFVGRQVDTMSWAALSFVGSAFVSFMISPKSFQKIKPMLKGQVAVKMLLLGIFYSIGSASMLLAYKYGNLTLVSPLRQTGIIVTTILAILLIKDERNRIIIKSIAAIISFIGVVLLII
jgi:drug/metabolite transporter (DMT)-like permease